VSLIEAGNISIGGRDILSFLHGGLVDYLVGLAARGKQRRGLFPLGGLSVSVALAGSRVSLTFAPHAA